MALLLSAWASSQLDGVKGVFARIDPDGIKLEDYQSHAAIKATMAA